MKTELYENALENEEIEKTRPSHFSVDGERFVTELFEYGENIMWLFPERVLPGQK